MARSEAGRVAHAARKQEVIRLRPRGLDPLLHGLAGSWRNLEVNRSLCCITTARDATWSPWQTSRSEGNEVASAKLAVDAKIEQRELAHSVLQLRRTRSAQMSLGLNGAFWPTILPLFHGWRWVAMPGVPMMVSRRVKRLQRCTWPILSRWVAKTHQRLNSGIAAAAFWQAGQLQSRPVAVHPERQFPPTN